MAVVSCSCSRVSSPSAFPSGGQSHKAMHHGLYGHQSSRGGSSFCPPRAWLLATCSCRSWSVPLAHLAGEQNAHPPLAGLCWTPFPGLGAGWWSGGCSGEAARNAALVHRPAEIFSPHLHPSDSSSSCLNLHSSDDSFFLFALLLGEARFRCGFTLALHQAEETCRLIPGDLSRQDNLQLPFPQTWLETCVGTRRFLPCGEAGARLTLGAEDGWAQPPAILRSPRGVSLFPAG